MAEKKESERTLEMRVAELEDKLKGLQISEEEMKVFNKVSSLLGGAALPGSTTNLSIPDPSSCVITQCIRSCTVVQQCIRACTIVQQCIRACTVIQQCIRSCIISDCIAECGGGCAPGGPFIGGGGFGTLGQ